ncbi:MAG: DNA repair protein RadA [Eubacteriales bacterium]|nr:DNA repair protein RadA [Eubacteriales bacterium]NLO13482.1 DNA repair protein RadA [Clostridiales bacterium]
MKAKNIKTIYICSACGYETPRWMGKCPGCEAWNTLEETLPQAAGSGRKPDKRPGGTGAEEALLPEIKGGGQMHQPTGIPEFDRVLGGGIVEGSLMLIGGEPGVGKSTLLLQVCTYLAGKGKRVLYVTGEESARQLKLRANRLKVGECPMMVLAENAMDAVNAKLEALSPDYVVVDSIQTMYRPDMASAPGSVSQVRESTSMLMRYAKTTGCAVMLVGHVTKEGALAGPRVLEHMVDVVLYFEGDYKREYRLLRANKNRFGSVNELGLFEMTGEGMLAVENASESLLQNRATGISGSVVFCGMEGSRPMLVDLQALAAQSFYAVPRRTVNGIDQGRVALLLAVLEKRAGLKLYNQDVYINVAGGLNLDEPAADLAVCLAVASSLSDKTLPKDVAAMGEVGLLGEVRSIPHMERRLAECARMGFAQVICPKDRLGRVKAPKGVKLLAVATLSQAVAALHLLATGDSSR